MSGHTPGPWAIGIETDNERAQVIASDGGHIAYVECDPVLTNARLIAAAPELLAALQYCFDCGFLTAHADDSEHDSDQKAQAVRAIAKAQP